MDDYSEWESRSKDSSYDRVAVLRSGNVVEIRMRSRRTQKDLVLYIKLLRNSCYVDETQILLDRANSIEDKDLAICSPMIKKDADKWCDVFSPLYRRYGNDPFTGNRPAGVKE